jgi:hypothetical protein
MLHFSTYQLRLMAIPGIPRRYAPDMRNYPLRYSIPSFAHKLIKFDLEMTFDDVICRHMNTYKRVPA